MDNAFLTQLAAGYEWQLSITALVLIMAGGWLIKQIGVRLVPAFRQSAAANKAVFDEKMQKPNYAANHKWNRKWAPVCLLVIFGGIVPFAITSQPQPLWNMAIDMVVILMFYDFFYYLVHRFLFHDEGLGGLLIKIHAVHHRQHNPCRMDSSYIHPLEVAMGLGLYAGSIFVLSRFMGDFHIATVVITWIAFSEINLHNHDRWEETRFPFGYVNTMAEMHHNHHAKFTGGNFATISLLYDWLFGTIDDGTQRTGLFKPAKKLPSSSKA